MRAFYFTLCIVAITALPPRQYKRPTERKLELTTEAKSEPKEPIEETKESADKKETPEKEVPRAYYENQSVNVVSTTSTTITEQEKLMPQVSYAPQVSIGKPQVNIQPVGIKNNLPALSKKHMMEMNDSDDQKKNVYTVNVYVNFPDDHDEHEHEEHDEEYYDDCYKGRCWGRVRCKEGQISVKGVCTDRA